MDEQFLRRESARIVAALTRISNTSFA